MLGAYCQKKNMHICDALRNLVAFVTIIKREKHPWRNASPWVFFKFFKLYIWYQIAQTVTYIQTNNITIFAANKIEF